MKFHRFQFVCPRGPHETHRPEYLVERRIGLVHIINPATAKTYCGRNADGWFFPYFREISTPTDGLITQIPTLQDVLANDDYFCKQCQRALVRLHK